MSQLDSDRNPVEVLAEEFASRVRKGEKPSMQTYAEQYPELADEINALFPSIAMMEALGSEEHAERKLETSQAVFAATPIERLGDFRIIRQIGRGGMGVVYEAEQESLDRLVAVKVLSSNAVSSPLQLQRFHREAHSAASLHHTNIVPIFGVGQQDDIHYYVMQLIDGVGLDQIVDELCGRTEAQASESNSGTGTAAKSSGTSAAAAAAALRNGRLVADTRNTGSRSWSTAKGEAAVDEARGASSAPSGMEETEVRTRERQSASAVNSDPHASGQRVASHTPDRSPEARGTADPLARKRRDLGDRYWKSVARMGVQLADALDYAHTQNVLHRDIKPANLLLDRHGTVWITDFGLAKHAESDDLTNTGDIVGTLRYMAPEQFNGDCTAQSDIYSLGVTLFELLTLRPAFGESQQGMLIQKITNAGTPAPRGINPSIPRDLETIVLKANANEPNRRYQTASQLADDLQRFLDDIPIQARRVTIPERMWRWSRRNPALATASLSAVLLLVLVAVVATWGNIRTNEALDRVSDERDKVRRAKDEAEQASASAEVNLAFAIETFKNIISKIASRGVPAALDIELQEGETAPHETALTEADAQLLQEMVEFFEEFAKNNRSDLRVETAEAYRSVGEIRRRLGQFNKALAAYNKAMKTYKQLSENESSIANVATRAKIVNEIALVHRDKGDFPAAILSHGKAVLILKLQPHEIADDRQCRFELVQTYLALASLWQPSGIISSDANSDGGGGDRPPPGRESRVIVPSPTPDSSRGDERRNSSPRIGHGRGSFGRKAPYELALVELERLIAEEPNNLEYKLAQARCYRMSMRGGWSSAHGHSSEALSKSIGILNTLVEQHPQEVAFKVELTETLLQTPVNRDAESVDDAYQTNIQRAAEVAQELVSSYPLVHQYRALLAGSQRKLGAIAQQENEFGQAELHYLQAVDHLESLVQDYPAVTIYQIALAQSRQRLGDLKRQQGQLDESHANLHVAISSFDGFRTERRSSFFYRRVAGSLYTSMAQTLEAMGKSTEAEDYRDQARRLNRRRRGSGRDGRGSERRGRTPRPETNEGGRVTEPS